MRFSQVLAMFGMLAASFSSLQASDIFWDSPQQISGESDVSLSGSPVRAYLFSSAGASSIINGVTFTPLANNVVPTDTSTFTYGNSIFGSASAPYVNMSTAYKSILANAYYNLVSGTTATLTLSGLTSGHPYQVQVWVNDSRSGINRTESVNASSAFSFNTTHVDGGLGQYITGTFTADGTGSKVLTFTPGSGVPAQVNGLQLRDLSSVPEPSTYALGAIASGVMAAIARRRKARMG